MVQKKWNIDFCKITDIVILESTGVSRFYLKKTRL